MYNPNDPQGLWWENQAEFDATFSYNQGKCEWTDLCPTNTPSSAPSVTCDPSKVVLADYPQWQDEEGYWVGELSLYKSDGLPFESSSWEYNYQTYKGFITGHSACNKYRRRNLFLYKALNETLDGSSKIFFADQEATATCDGNIEGPYVTPYGTFESKTTLVGRDNSVLYQVFQPEVEVPGAYACEESITQSQLTTFNTRSDGTKQRTRTAQGFNGNCDFYGPNAGKQSYASFYRETKVTKERFYEELNETVMEYNIPQRNLGAFLSDGTPSNGTGFAFVEDHLESSFELQCD